ncbi:MAG TPA: SHOCT domain-containing protein [Acidimicrobiales bacterium]|nr:SHOCT domain-containing protein [Acidimicrobiales bacterium]
MLGTLTLAQYPLLDAFLTILYFAALVIFIWVLIMVIFDIFRSRDLGGWGKALWLIFIVVLPVLGIIVYLIARGGSMHERSVQQAQQSDAQMQAYIKQTAAKVTPADELAKLADLKAKGVITDAEFEQQKAKILAA